MALRLRDFYKVCSLSSSKCLAENYAAQNYLGNFYSVGFLVVGGGCWGGWGGWEGLNAEGVSAALKRISIMGLLMQSKMSFM